MSDNKSKKKLKLDAEVLASIFSPIRRAMGIPNDYRPNYAFTRYKVRTDWKDTLREGVTIQTGDPNFTYDEKTGELLYKGVKVLLYIRDQTNPYLQNVDLSQYTSKYKFHIAYCSTLESMYQQGKYEKYVVSTRNDGFFLVRLSNGHDVATSTQELKVCKNCLKRLNYKNYNNVTYPEQRRIYENFALEEFFSVKDGNYRFLGTLPRKTDKNAPVNEYTDDWAKISNMHRQRVNWKCERCGKDCSRNHGDLHVHHKDGIKSNNQVWNLEALCTVCHTKEHPHMKGLQKSKKPNKAKVQMDSLFWD